MIIKIPSAHAMRASKALDGGDIEAHIIDHHAIAPAVAERDAEIANLRSLCVDRDYHHQRAIDLDARLRTSARELASTIGCLAETEAKLAERDKRIAELEARIAKQNAIIDRLNHCGSDTQRLDWLERMCFDLTESKGRWCVSEFLVERAHYGKTVREAIDEAFERTLTVS